MTLPIFVIVFAHPDDESMFFLPTIRSLVDSGETVWFLCLTTGDYDGLGKIRQKELQKVGKLLGVSRVIVRSDDVNGATNDASFLDHPTKRHDERLVADAIRDSLSNHFHQSGPSGESANQFVLVTFDQLGVSGHVNHIDTYLGVRRLMDDEEQEGITSKPTPGEENGIRQPRKNSLLEAWHLESERNILRKYVPLLSWILLVSTFFTNKFTSMCTRTQCSDNTSIRIFRMHNPVFNWKAMATHHSQFVWYRRLFVVFSCYTYCNKFVCRKSMPRRRKQGRVDN
mmetsp:Transcript_9560/g.28537  ORF Transcript_9560/g.28537 Transcript_9560/m.28537 type:complete len:284 (+) Transcript_9560:65-916(+)